MFFQKISNSKWLATAMLAIAPSVLFTNCKKDDGGDDKGNPIPVTNIHDVYVSAIYDTITPMGTKSNACAGYYYNGRLYNLPGQADNANTYAYDICVDGRQIYVAGMENNQAVYWQNGEIVYLPEGTAATGIVVKNGSVYVCGHEATYSGDVACCWINNTKYVLQGGSRAQDIQVDEQGHVYIIGHYFDFMTGKYALRYWTDAEASRISQYSIPCGNSLDGRCISLDYTHMKNSRPFICLGGMESVPSVGNVNKNWVERKETTLSAAASGNELTSNSACNGKLYSCGNDRTVAKYWVTTIGHRGEGENLQTFNLTDGGSQWYAVGIHAVDDVAYVVGYEAIPFSHSPTVWKNGERFIDMASTLTNIFSIEPTGIYVVSRPVMEPVPVLPVDTVSMYY